MMVPWYLQPVSLPVVLAGGVFVLVCLVVGYWMGRASVGYETPVSVPRLQLLPGRGGGKPVSGDIFDEAMRGPVEDDERVETML